VQEAVQTLSAICGKHKALCALGRLLPAAWPEL